MASTLKKGLTWLRAPTNALGFALRRRFRYSRGCPILVNEDKTDLFAYLDPEQRRAVERLRARLESEYALGDLSLCSTQLDFRDNLYVIHTLEQLADITQLELPSGQVSVCDVGSKNWSYAFAEARFFTHYGLRDGESPRSIELVGVEIDGHGLYPDLRSRADHAAAYAAQVENAYPAADVDYRVADFLDADLSQVDVVTLFYPFLTRYALLQWGLPVRCYKPAEILERAFAALRPGGTVIVFNQTAREKERLRGLLADLGIKDVASIPVRSQLVHYHEVADDRWATLARQS